MIMEEFASHSQETFTSIQGYLHPCKNHPSQYIYFQRKRRAHLSNPPEQLIHPSTRRFVNLSLSNNMVKHSMRICNKEIPSVSPYSTCRREQ